MFTDELTIVVKSGAGGRGCESYRKRQDHKRLPDGGDGGNGGSVILAADPQTGSLAPLKSKPTFEAERGSHGMGNNRYGHNGKDYIVKVPCGTTVYNKCDHLLIRDLVVPNEQVVVLRSGKGGHGNHNGGKATGGEAAQGLELFLSFKIISDICLVGLPNSGKTALLKTLTGAGVSATEYPFATKSPQLGTYRSDKHELHLCDLPSLYQASTDGRGLGTHYLKHLERAKLVFFVLDTETKFAHDVRSGFRMLFDIVKSFNPDFAKKPRFVVVNKTDMLPEKRIEKAVLPEREKCFAISTLEGTGVKRLMSESEKVLKKEHGTAV